MKRQSLSCKKSQFQPYETRNLDVYRNVGISANITKPLLGPVGNRKALDFVLRMVQAVRVITCN
jgi:hypothetical protein